MAILSKEEFFERLKSRIGEDTSEDAITFMEDFTDTYEDYERVRAQNGEEWREKYERNDEEWRRRYRDRFFGPGNDTDVVNSDSTSRDAILEAQETNVKDDGEKRTYEDLFKEREG